MDRMLVKQTTVTKKEESMSDRWIECVNVAVSVSPTQTPLWVKHLFHVDFWKRKILSCLSNHLISQSPISCIPKISFNAIKIQWKKATTLILPKHCFTWITFTHMHWHGQVLKAWLKQTHWTAFLHSIRIKETASFASEIIIVQPSIANQIGTFSRDYVLPWSSILYIPYTIIPLVSPVNVLSQISWSQDWSSCEILSFLGFRTSTKSL